MKRRKTGAMYTKWDNGVDIGGCGKVAKAGIDFFKRRNRCVRDPCKKTRKEVKNVVRRR